MKTISAAWFGLLLLTSGVADAAPPPTAAVYAEVAQHLEPGGNFYMVITFEGAMERLSGRLTDFLTLATAGKADAANTRKTALALIEHLKRGGLFDLSAMGVSTVPRQDGDFDLKMFLRAQGSAEKPLLKAMFGAPPGELDALRFMPSDTVLASVGSGDMSETWTFVREAILAVLKDDAGQAFRDKLSAPNPLLGMGLDEMLNGLGSQGAFALTLSETTQCSIPTGAGMIDIPAPSALFVLKLKDESVGNRLLALDTMGGFPVQHSMRQGVPIRALLFPAPVPFPFQLSFSVVDGYLVLATTPDTLERAVEAGANRTGLAATTVFKDAFAGLPLSACSGLGYSSRRFGKELQRFQAQAAGQNPGMPADLRQNLQRLVSGDGTPYSATVSINTGTGLLQRGVTSTGGGEILGALAMAPVGMMAAIAVPSFVKARSTSSGNACINNLRQIDAAKEQWALEQNAPNNAEVDIEGVLQYIKGARMPVCPAGGTYQLRRFGEDPVCSHPGHSL